MNYYYYIGSDRSLDSLTNLVAVPLTSEWYESGTTCRALRAACVLLQPLHRHVGS